MRSTHGCRTLLAREQRRMRGEYEIRLRELERERIHAEQDKAQVPVFWNMHGFCADNLPSARSPPRWAIVVFERTYVPQ